MNRYFKKALLINLLFLLFISFSFGQDITLTNNETNLTEDVKQIKKVKIINNKWVEINAIVANIKSNNLKLETLINENNLSKSKRLTDLAKDKPVIAAINGDFFNPKTKTAIGPLIKNSKLIYNGTTDKRFSKFALTKTNEPYICNWNLFNYQIETKNISFKVDYKNKDYTKNNNIILLDRSFNNYSIGSNKNNITEIIIKNNKISEILKNKPKTKIPENGYVLSIPNHKNIIDNLKIGDKININKNNNLDIFNSAIGGGAILVKNGLINNDLKLKINGNHPRSAIGYTQNKEKIILATVNGRKSFFPGVSEKEMAQIMIDLESNYAMSLDGGGSSTLIKREFGKNQFEILNNLSDGYERKIYNGIAITNKNKTSKLDKLKTNIDNKLIYKTPYKFNVLGVNKDYYPIKINKDKLKISSTLDHKVKNNTFIPLESGKGKITFKYEDLQITKNISVYEEFEKLEVFPKQINLTKGQNKNIEFYLYTKDEIKLPIKPNNLKYLSKNYFEFDNSLFSLNENIKDKTIKFSYNNLKTQLKINKPLKNIVLNNFENINGKLDVYPSNVLGKIEKFNNTYLKLNYDFTNYNNKTQAVYYEFNKPIKINRNTKNINLKVDGTHGKNHWLRMEIKDLEGNKQNITLARNINWNGLKTIKYPLDENLDKPFYINRIYLVETDPKKFNKGYILLDELSIEQSENTNNNTNNNNNNIFKHKIKKNNGNFIHITNKYIDPPKDDILISYNKDILNEFENKSFNLNNTFAHFEKSNKLFLKLNNKNNTFFNHNGIQWEFIINKLKNNKNKNIFIFLDNNLNFNNKIEEKIFFNILNELPKNPSIFFIINSDKFNLNYYNSYPIIKLNKNEKYNLKFKTNLFDTSFEIKTF
ncbi:MAG: phosphodiester glycosidase family protein [Bacillota bacterium]